LNRVDPIGLADEPPLWMTIKNAGNGLEISSLGNFQVKQWFTIQVQATFCCQGEQCKIDVTRRLGPGINLDRPPKEGEKPHGHPHETGNEGDPRWQEDNGVDQFGRENVWYPLDLKAGKMVYEDHPNTTQVLLENPS
jgi:hypothetical protein